MKLAIALLWVVSMGPQETHPEDRLYGRVTTAAGDVFEGYLRWGPNEGSWVDLINGNKEIPWEHLREAEELDDEYRDRRSRERSIRFLGLRISWDEDDTERSSVASGVRFGHLQSLEVVDNSRALLVLKSGNEVEFDGGSSDIGRSLRSLRVDDPRRGITELRWRDLERVDFMPAPVGAVPTEQRLHGTLTTFDGLSFTGYVAWDTDEIFTTDVLDGEDEDGRDREIPFGRIASIEQDGRRAALVVLETGEEVWLRGTNDVNDENRGIAITDPQLGQVVVEWNEFDQIRFHAPAARTGGRYDAFDGGRRLRGIVTTRAGETFEGFIRWDNDEEFTWEILDGSMDGIDFDIEFGHVQRVEPLSYRGADVTLHDGRRFELEGSNDVDEDNKGLFVGSDRGETLLVRWEDVESVVFTR